MRQHPACAAEDELLDRLAVRAVGQCLAQVGVSEGRLVDIALRTPPAPTVEADDCQIGGSLQSRHGGRINLVDQVRLAGADHRLLHL
jgi:hypothetical protein